MHSSNQGKRRIFNCNHVFIRRKQEINEITVGNLPTSYSVTKTWLVNILHSKHHKKPILEIDYQSTIQPASGDTVFFYPSDEEGKAFLQALSLLHLCPEDWVPYLFLDPDHKYFCIRANEHFAEFGKRPIDFNPASTQFPRVTGRENVGKT
jgi:hypothetical protein